MHRAAQGEKKLSAKGITGSGKHGGVSEKVVEVVEVQRYWPGKAPKGFEDAEFEAEEGFMETEQHGPEVQVDTGTSNDRRLQRLAVSRESGSGRRRESGAVIEEQGSRRSRAAAVIEEVSSDGEDSEDAPTGAVAATEEAVEEEDEEEDEDAIEARRERLIAMRKKRAAQDEEKRRAEEEAAEEEEEEAAKDDEEESSECADHAQKREPCTQRSRVGVWRSQVKHVEGAWPNGRVGRGSPSQRGFRLPDR